MVKHPLVCQTHQAWGEYLADFALPEMIGFTESELCPYKKGAPKWLLGKLQAKF